MAIRLGEGDRRSMQPEPTSGGPYGVNRAARRRRQGSTPGGGERYGSESGLGGSRVVGKVPEAQAGGRPQRRR